MRWENGVFLMAHLLLSKLYGCQTGCPFVRPPIIINPCTHVSFIHAHFLCQLAILACLLCLPCRPCLPRLHPQVWPAMPFLKSPLPSSSRSNNIQWPEHIPLIGGLEHVFLFHILGMSSSQLTFAPSFFRGVASITTNQIILPLPKMARPFFAVGFL